MVGLEHLGDVSPCSHHDLLHPSRVPRHKRANIIYLGIAEDDGKHFQIGHLYGNYYGIQMKGKN